MLLSNIGESAKKNQKRMPINYPISLSEAMVNFIKSAMKSSLKYSIEAT